MGKRVQLQTILEMILGSDQVWFQPGPNVSMSYPAIIYRRSNDDTEFANNKPYIHTRRYQVTVIDADPDSEIPDKVAMLPMCTSDRDFTVNNLNHWIYNLYF